MKHTDIDIDLADRDLLLKHIQYTDASMINDDIIKKHNVGVYLQDIPTFLDTKLSSIDYKDAGEYGYFKLDLLNNSIYENIATEKELDKLLGIEPDWNLLQDESVVKGLFQLGKHSKMLRYWKPRSVLELAMFIAMIRPSKKYLLEKESWGEVEKEIWVQPTNNEPYFKKSHSIAYAMAIKVQLNLINNF